MKTLQIITLSLILLMAGSCRKSEEDVFKKDIKYLKHIEMNNHHIDIEYDALNRVKKLEDDGMTGVYYFSFLYNDSQLNPQSATMVVDATMVANIYSYYEITEFIFSYANDLLIEEKRIINYVNSPFYESVPENYTILIQYEYINRRLNKVIFKKPPSEYMMGDTIIDSLTYDDKGYIYQLFRNSRLSLTYEYDESGNLIKSSTSSSNTDTDYVYDNMRNPFNELNVLHFLGMNNYRYQSEITGRNLSPILKYGKNNLISKSEEELVSGYEFMWKYEYNEFGYPTKRIGLIYEDSWAEYTYK